ncbi:hypothetical protein V9T40_012803 [Parthenolecanium corni]|uniref:Uncharacterized protein n=1 Tax=Parthenolecanium corni TaxID=536013 RepID=A0AAN9T7Y2_9HEMI
MLANEVKWWACINKKCSAFVKYAADGIVIEEKNDGIGLRLQGWLLDAIHTSYILLWDVINTAVGELRPKLILNLFYEVSCGPDFLQKQVSCGPDFL